MDVEKILDDITPDMLPKPYSLYAKAIGIKNLYRLVNLTGGKTIYLPKPTDCFKEAIKQKIIQEYENEACSLQDLATKYELSKKTVWTYIKTAKTKKTI